LCEKLKPSVPFSLEEHWLLGHKLIGEEGDMVPPVRRLRSKDLETAIS
jgi:hypothetical protein